MADETIKDLRDVIFETIRAVRDPENTLDLDRAKAVNDLAQTVINTAKVEVDYLRYTGQRTATDFLPVPEARAPALPGKGNGAR